MKFLRLLLVAILLSSVGAFSTASITTAAPKLSSKTIAGWDGPKSGKEGAYICTKKKCGGLAVVVYENDRLSRAQAREFEKAKTNRKRFDRYFKLGFKLGNVFSKTKVHLKGSSSAVKIGKQTAIGQAIEFKGKNESGMKDGYVILLPVEKRQHTFAAIAASSSKAKSLAIKFAKGLRF